MGQNYHLIHHLWPSIPWYYYERAYYQSKPLLDEKGAHQSLGILQTTEDLFGFVYDVFLGIRLHKSSQPDETLETVKSSLEKLAIATTADTVEVTPSPEDERKLLVGVAIDE